MSVRLNSYVFMGSGFLAMRNMYGETTYPPATLATSITNGLLTPVSKSNGKYRQATREAIEIALDRLCPTI